jgi:DNA-binding transcriptional LysR family regulator
MQPDPRNVSADDLRHLLAVARTGRLTAAASLLGVDHTTVRRHIDRLERALGARLLDRGADGWQLTAIGRDVVVRAAPLESVVEQVVSAATHAPETLRGFVRVVAPEGFGVAFVSPALAALRNEHPDITVELVTLTRPLSLRGSGFDIAITVGSPSSSRIPAEPLAEYVLRLYASHDYLAAHEPIRVPSDLAGHPLVFYVDALLTVRELDLAPLVGDMRVGFGSTNVFAQLDATRRGAGIGLLHAFMAEHVEELEPVLPGAVEFRLAFYLATRGAETAVVAAARDAIRREAAARANELIPS